jgi:predicted DsbA family dithiol-disulfide isomerase
MAEARRRAYLACMPGKLPVDVWSDVVCPWCAIGKRRLEQALAQFPHRDDVDVVWHAFELDPGAPAVQSGDNASRLARKYGRTRDEALAMMRHVEGVAAKDGLELQLTTARSGNTFDAHRVIRLAAEHGLQGAVKERLLRGYMTENEAIGEREVLVKLAAEAGLDAEEVRATLASDRFGAEVRDDEGAARSLGINGVPFFVFGGKYAVSGAQPAPVMLRALEQAWAHVESEAREQTAEEGAACGPDGCA